MKIKISATFIGKCDICGKTKKVFTVGDEDTKMVLTICEDCANRYSKESVEEMINKFGHKDEEAFKNGVRKYGKSNAS